MSEVEAPKVIIPYTPRKHFLPIHASQKRFKFVVMHRRAGKSVGAINEMIKKALENTRKFPHPRYAYVGPSFDQTKDLIWGYLKTYAGGIPGVKFSEGDLECTLPNGATIRLYGGAAAYERMRGLYFDGVMLDEFPLLNPVVFSTVVRPCLADYRGWAIVSGTSAGDDHFHELKKRAEKDPSWDVFVVPVTATDALHPDEVREMTQDMSAEEYAQEMLCSFDTPVVGAYYAEALNEIQLKKRITRVEWQRELGTITWWDLGIDDYMAIWFAQIAGKEIHVIDYLEDTGKGLEYYAKAIKDKPYIYRAHVLPHDIKARELGTGRSRYEVLSELLPDIIVAPQHKVEDGITAARTILASCWFDETRTATGLSALRNYHKNPKTGKPVHNWASHAADAFRIGSISFNYIDGYMSASNVISMRGGLRVRRRGTV